jgi:hypothetical protein
MNRALQYLFLSMWLVLPQASWASFHLINIEEIYSNADGTIQYIVLHVNADSQNRLVTHNIKTTGPGNVVQTFPFPMDLPSTFTNGHRVLIATQGFAALNLVTPDYIVPNGFVPTVNGIVDYASAIDSWTYAALPTDGVNALYVNGVVNANLATNFAGASAAVIPAPTKLAITSVNGGFYPLVGQAFNVVVQAQDAAGVPRFQSTDQAVSLSLHTGTGPLGGTLACVITGGQSACIAAPTYPVQDTGVSVTAGCSCSLTPGNSGPFNVILVAGPAPNFVGAASRKVHGAAGAFDLPLNAATTSPTTEPRQGPAQTIVFTFDKPIGAATVAIIEGTLAAAAPAFGGNDVVVGLTGVTDHQYATISLTNVSSLDGGTGGSGSVRIGFLIGDVNQSRVVSVGDLGLVNAQLAQPVTAANFLKDVNATGTLTVGDKGITNANLTRSLPAP